MQDFLKNMSQKVGFLTLYNRGGYILQARKINKRLVLPMHFKHNGGLRKIMRILNENEI